MDQPGFGQDEQRRIEQVLGYLNFSAGTEDPGFQQNLNLLFGRLAADNDEKPTFERLGDLLSQQLAALHGTKPAFNDIEQAAAAVRTVFGRILPAYRRFHRDLLFHQSETTLWQPLFLARVFEEVLRCVAEGGQSWDDAIGLEEAVVRRLNNYIGYRPVAVLENERKVEPYPHEWVRPIPIYIREAGVGVGRYQALVEQALAILRETDAEVLQEACFDLNLLDELAIDPRAYDFDHPVNGRPNYVFGQWDPHQLDNSGRYRRFVLRQITIDALVDYIDKKEAEHGEEAKFEAGAVLAGVILMASGVTGSGPDTHDSSVSLGRLVMHIAAYRDVFYERLLDRLDGPMGERLRGEAMALKQPLARARGHLNRLLARRRAAQIEHVALAKLYARMGYPAAARRQAAVVPAAAARMLCEIDCRLTTANHATDRGDHEQAAEELVAVEDWLQRAIQCGAIVDPWNILGFQGNFSLFVALEDSVRDHRVEELIERMDRIFNALGRLGVEAAAAGNKELEGQIFARFQALCDWWDQFASIEVEGLPELYGSDSFQSARRVADALAQWQQAGSAAGDIAFWSEHVEQFQSARAYAPVVDALLNQRDQVAAMALLMQWLSQADLAGLDAGEISFHVLAVRWLRGVHPRSAEDDEWGLIRRFFDFFEANAGEYWHVPQFLYAEEFDDFDEGEEIDALDFDEDDADDDDQSAIYGAAYEEVVYVDSTADGLESDLMDDGADETLLELDQEARRLNDRLTLLAAVATLWKLASRQAAAMPMSKDTEVARQRDETLGGWLSQAKENKRQLLRLLHEVSGYRITLPGGSPSSMMDYDRQRRIQQMVLERTIAAYVETSVAQRTILGAMNRPDDATLDLPEWAALTVEGLRCAFRHDLEGVRERLPRLVAALRQQPLLYVPLSHRGDPTKVAEALDVQRVLVDLLRGLPRLGLLTETCGIIDAVQAMETEHPVGPGAVTQFDHLFQVGYQSIVECLVRSANSWSTSASEASETSVDASLVDWIETLTALLLNRWLRHSRLLRLSVFEALSDEKRWQGLKKFIQRYGHDLFTQRFFNPGNLRAILDSGVGNYLDQLDRTSPVDERPRLLDELDQRIARDEAIAHLKLVIEAVIENYECYRDYNATTTQSDRGEMLYALFEFLRLKVAYERLAWNLRPVMSAHDVLVRGRRDEAAELWRRAIVEKTSDMADHYLAEYDKLVKQCGMTLPTVGDLLAERFVRPLALDRIRALIEPAVDEVRSGAQGESFALLEQELDDFTRTPTGSGLDAPIWLEQLENEVDQAQATDRQRSSPPPLNTALDWTPLPLEEVQRQVHEIRRLDEDEVH